MKFLIVNGFTSTPLHQKQFHEFLKLIQDITQSQYEIADIDLEFVVVDRNTIDQYLFEPETSLIKIENGQQFDSIDMIFIIAPSNSKPWNPNMRKIITLIRMCIKTKKLLFMTSFGAQALAYLCSSNINTHINITNGNGDGCKLVDFPKYTIQALSNGHQDFFLDSTTGDLFYYNKGTDEWIPKTNVGIHHRRDAMEYQSIGKYVVKSPTYKPKQQMLSNLTEQTCTIKKMFLHYWLFKNVSIEFQVRQTNMWDIHSITFTNSDKKFLSLADNNVRGPLIIKSNNIVAILYDLDIKSQDQINIIRNFIEHGLKVIRYANGYNAVSITNEKYYSSPSTGFENIQLIYHTNKTNHDNSRTLEYRKLINKAIVDNEDRDKILHVGFSVKKDRLPELVEQNNIQVKKMQAWKRKSFLAKKQEVEKYISRCKDITNLLDQHSSPKTSRRHIKIKTESKVTQITLQTQDDDIQPIPLTQRVLSQVEVRKLLHPSLDDQYLGDSKIWVPGYLKFKTKNQKSSLPNSHRHTPNHFGE